MTTTRHRPTTTATPTAVIGPQASTLTGMPVMLAVFWRRSRLRIAVWAIGLISLFGFVAVYYQGLFTTQRALDDFAAVSDVPSIKALTGLAAAANTMGGAVWTKIWMTCAVALAFAVLFLVTRHGRGEEEAGRTELLRSRMLGLHAASAASWLLGAALATAVGVGIAAFSILVGLDPDGSGVQGSLILGSSVTGVGLIGLGAGAVAGQVATTARGANTIGAVVLGAAYLLRMAGDLSGPQLTWASPIGWAEEMQPWAENRWWPLALILALVVAALVVAVAIERRRDLGAGLLPDRAGRASAPARYTHPLGLGLRLQRGSIIGWTITVLLLAIIVGSVVQAMTNLLADAGPAVALVAGGPGLQALLSLLTVLLVLLVTVFAVQSALTLRTDEASGILETEFAAPLSRIQWAVQRLLIPVLGSGLLLVLGGGTLGSVAGSTTGDADRVLQLLGAALAYWPAVLVYVGIAVLLFGWAPRHAAALTSAVLAITAVVLIAGDALGLPDWILDLLPLSATPYQPLDRFTVLPLVLLTIAAAVFTTVGLARFARRDLQPA